MSICGCGKTFAETEGSEIVCNKISEYRVRAPDGREVEICADHFICTMEIIEKHTLIVLPVEVQEIDVRCVFTTKKNGLENGNVLPEQEG